MTVAEIKEYIDKRQKELGNSDPYEEYAWYDISAELTQIRSMLDELEPKEEWTDIEKSLECLRVEMLNLPTDFDKTVADDHLESLRYIFITQFKESEQ